MKYPEQLFIYCNENDDYSWDCNEGETWIGEVEYILKSEHDTLTATIAQKDAEIVHLQSRVQELEAELMFYQMECPDLVGRYQPPKEE